MDDSEAPAELNRQPWETLPAILSPAFSSAVVSAWTSRRPHKYKRYSTRTSDATMAGLRARLRMALQEWPLSRTSSPDRGRSGERRRLLNLMLGSERYGGRIAVCDYDPGWPALFEGERASLETVLGSMAITIEHVGSTAVPGLAAKPIVDLLVGVHVLADARSCCIERLRPLGYRYMAEYESWLPDEMLFRKGMPGPWTHHVHVMEPSSPRWQEFILIRDYLRRRPEMANVYANLKRTLALAFDDDIAGYRAAKRPFLQAVMVMAQAEGDPEPDSGR